ncbi:MAG: M48 family metallopeptidase [Clostridia bacterium]|nr:M48 family metallopeptidase [Clostridia bacterium]
MKEKMLVIILALIGGFFPILLNLFKRKSAKNPIPENVGDVYDDETYTKWRSYQAEHSRLDLLSGIASLAVVLVLLFTNAFSAFASLFPDKLVWQVLSVILLDTLVSTVVGLFFDYYSTMVIEQKYGFNKSTIKTFVVDKIRGLIVSLALNLFLGFLIALLHSWLEDYIIILLTVVLFLFSLLMSFLYPVLSRIGNKFTSLEEGELRTNLMNLLTSHGYKVGDIKVMDASRRTTKLNAYFSGFGSTKTIVLYDNLVNAMTPDEICAVFAHELGHGLHKDVMKMQIMNIGNLLLMAVAVWISVREGSLHTAFGFSDVNYGFAYILTGIFISLIQPLTSMIINAYSRKAEYRADKQAVSEGYGEAMIVALKKLARENFAELAPTRISVLLEYSHPPLSDRIAAVERQISNKEG